MKLLTNVAAELNTPIVVQTNGINCPPETLLKEIPLLNNVRKYVLSSDLACYVVEKPSHKLFRSAYSDYILREAFGIVLRSETIAVRPLPMFCDIPREHIFHETRIDIEGKNVCGLEEDGEIRFLTRNGKIIDGAPDGAKSLISTCAPLGLTAQFTVVDPYELHGVISEIPGWYLVGIRSITTGRILPLRHLVQIAGDFGLQPIILFQQDRTSFINNSHHKGLIDFFVNKAGEQFLTRELTIYYRQILPIINFLRYGRDVGGYIRKMIECPDICCRLSIKERMLYDFTKTIIEKREKGEKLDEDEKIKKEIKIRRKTLISRSEE